MQQEQDTISLAFGVISYLRCLFSDESFQDCKQGPLTLKTLRNTPETRKMMEWIASINKSRESIHKVVLGLYLHEGDENVKGRDNARDCIADSAGDASARLVEMYSFTTDTQFDFRTLCKTLQSMKILRGRYTVRLKVYTTLFIEIAGFKRTDQLWDSGHLQEKEISGFRLFSSDAREGELDRANGINIEGMGGINKVDEINCSCTINSDEKQMIACSMCNHWVHASCHGYFSAKDKRIKPGFCCFLCLGLHSKEIRDCSVYRRTLSILYNEPLLHSTGDTGIKENGGAGCEGNGTSKNGINAGNKDGSMHMDRNSIASFFSTRLEISLNFANGLVTRLRADGFLENGRNKSLLVVKSREIKEKIKGYFNGRRMECLISMSDIKCEIQ